MEKMFIRMLLVVALTAITFVCCEDEATEILIEIENEKLNYEKTQGVEGYCIN